MGVTRQPLDEGVFSCIPKVYHMIKKIKMGKFWKIAGPMAKNGLGGGKRSIAWQLRMPWAD